MIDKAVNAEPFSINNPMPPFHILQSNHRVYQLVFTVVHIAFFGFIE